MSKKKKQKNSKNQKKPLWLIFKRKQAGKAREREKMQGKRENKNYRFVQFQPDGLEKIPIKQKKN